MGAMYTFFSNRYYGVTEKIMGIIIPFGKQKFSRLSSDLVIKEGNLGKIKPGQRGAVIGSGPLPFTAILFTKSFDINMYSVDKSISASAVARRFLKKAFPDEKIKVIKTAGECFNNNIDFAFLTLCAAPKNQLIKSLFQNNENNINFRIIARIPVGIHKKRFDDVDVEMLRKNYDVLEVTHHMNCVFKTIVVFNKKRREINT